MINHYLRHAFKVLLRDRFHSFLNIFGLSFGIAICIVVLLYVQSDLNFMGDHKKADRIFMYGVQMTIGGRTSAQTNCNMAVGPVLKEYITEIESYARFGGIGEVLVSANEKFMYEDEFYYGDSSTFNIFTYEFVLGNPKTALYEPNTMVITDKIAHKYFGDKNPIGEVMDIEDNGFFKIIGVIKDQYVDEYSELGFDGLLSFSTLYQNPDNRPVHDASSFGSNMGYYVYFLFKEGFTEQMFYDQFKLFYEEKLAEIDPINYVPLLDKLQDFYLNSKIYVRYANQNSRILRTYIFIGLFILLLACINYINMATSRAAFRSREIGVKKVMGATKIHLRLQLLGESFIVTFIAFIIGFGIAELVLNFTSFNDLVGKTLSIDILHNPVLVIGSIILLFFVSFISGIYPAFYLSGILPIKAIKNEKESGTSRSVLRNVLIILQFTISITIITVALLMKSQISYMMDKDLGFDKENVMIISVQDQNLRDKMPSLKSELLQYSGIKSISISHSAPSMGISGYAFGWENEEGEMESQVFREMIVDNNYYETMGIEILKGQNFFRPQANPDGMNFDMIVNEALVKFMGWENPIGKKSKYGQVIGVVKDYNFSSLRGEILPMYSRLPFENPELLIINIRPDNFASSMELIENKWTEFAPNVPFRYEFMDERLKSFYENDQRQRKLSSIFSILCILISSLGLFGLTSYITMRKTKEIAIRKTFGAGLAQLLSTLFKQILILIGISGILSIPAAYLIYDNWLDQFAYPVNLNYFIFAITIFGAIMLAFIVSLYHYLKVIGMSIVESLRYE